MRKRVCPGLRSEKKCGRGDGKCRRRFTELGKEEPKSLDNEERWFGRGCFG